MNHPGGIGKHWLFLLLTAFVIADILNCAGEGWLPHDEGLLGQSATRVLQGELPHRDFDETYTGGQAIWHSFVFRLLGQDSYSLRLVLAVLAVGSFGAVYSLALRFASPLIASLAAATAYVWSFPVYFAPLPSWYNLALGLFGICALAKFADSKRESWVFVAGLIGGLSFLVKISGLYYAAAAYLFLLLSSSRVDALEKSGSRSRRHQWFAIAVVAGFIAAVVMLIRKRLTVMDSLHFALPSVLIGITLCFIQYRREPNCFYGDTVRAIRNWVVFTMGFLLPITLFLVPYVSSGSLVMWLEGVFVLPQQRLSSASFPLPNIPSLICVLPVLGVFALRAPADSWVRGRFVVIVFSIVCVLVAVFGSLPFLYLRIWGSARPLIPLLVGVGCWGVVCSSRVQSKSSSNENAFLVLAMTATMSLVQFPFSAPVYFCYVAPLVVVSALACSSMGEFTGQHKQVRGLQIGVLGCYCLFGLIWLRTGYVSALGSQHVVVPADDALGLKTATLQVPHFEANVYRPMVEEIQRRSDVGSSIFATSDCPEVYYLSERRNPTRTIYDFFDSDFRSDSIGRNTRLLQMIDREKIQCVVLRWKGEFSGEVNAELAKALIVAFPNRRDFRFFPESTSDTKPDFTVLWKNRD